MQAVVVDEYGGAPMLAELPKPRSGPGQVLTKLLAAEMSPLDRKLVSGDRRSAGGVRDGARR
jgi:NADPH:quinone reductase-like Zn-dependent oxidoreductase